MLTLRWGRRYYRANHGEQGADGEILVGEGRGVTDGVAGIGWESTETSAPGVAGNAYTKEDAPDCNWRSVPRWGSDLLHRRTEGLLDSVILELCGNLAPVGLLQGSARRRAARLCQREPLTTCGLRRRGRHLMIIRESYGALLDPECTVETYRRAQLATDLPVLIARMHVYTSIRSYVKCLYIVDLDTPSSRATRAFGTPWAMSCRALSIFSAGTGARPL